MSKRVVSKANTPTRCGHGRLRTDCGFCARDDEIERLRAENTELLRVMRKVFEDGHTDCVADADPGAARCDKICRYTDQMCAGCQLRVTLHGEGVHQ